MPFYYHQVKRVLNSSGTTNRAPEVVYVDGDHAIATLGNVVLSHSLNSPNPQYLGAWRAATAKAIRESDGPIYLMTVIDSRAGNPDDAAREEIRETMLHDAASVSRLAYVVDGYGFGAAAKRSVLSLISMVARYPFPQKVFSSVREASSWLGTGDAPAPLEIARAVELMRSAADERRGESE